MAKKFEVTILGVNSAYPIHGRHPSCQVVNYDDRLIMIDCGEAAQIQVAKYGIKKGRINHIFISHLHGDHCYGLPGLLTSFSLNGRTSKLLLHGPFGLKKFLNAIFEASSAYFSYELEVLEYNTEVCNKVEVDSSIIVETFPMKHRMPTMGFRIVERLQFYNVKKESIDKYSLTIDEIKEAKLGKSVFRDQKEIPNAELIYPKGKQRSYAYCSDTVYDPELVPYISDSTLLYHEATYLDDLEVLALERMHSTLGQAIDIAKQSQIKKLIVGHFSSRYIDTNIFLEQGLPLFENLLLGEEGRVYPIQ